MQIASSRPRSQNCVPSILGALIISLLVSCFVPVPVLVRRYLYSVACNLCILLQLDEFERLASRPDWSKMAQKPVLLVRLVARGTIYAVIYYVR